MKVLRGKNMTQLRVIEDAVLESLDKEANS